MKGQIRLINSFSGHKRIMRVYYSPLFFTVYLEQTCLLFFRFLLNSFLFLIMFESGSNPHQEQQQQSQTSPSTIEITNKIGKYTSFIQSWLISDTCTIVFAILNTFQYLSFVFVPVQKVHQNKKFIYMILKVVYLLTSTQKRTTH